MIKRTLLAVTVVFGLVGLVPTTASALSCGITIFHSKTLHHDLDCSAMTTGYAITFGKPHLKLNLNGHKILGPVGNDTASGVYSEFKDSTVTNGTIEDFDRYGVFLYNTTGSRATDLKVLGDTTGTPYGVYDEYGIHNVIRHVTGNNLYYGLYLYGGAQNRILQNVLKNGTYGVYSDYEYADVLRGNVSTGTSYGIYDDYSNLVSYLNNTTNGGVDGIYLDCDTDGAPNRVMGNTANNNSGDGITSYYCYNDPNYQQGGGVYRNNTANNNGSDGFYEVSSRNETYLGNTADNNDEEGFNLDYPIGMVFVNNTANGNHNDTGVYITDAQSDYGPVTVSNNTADNNNAYGLQSDYGVPGSGNHANGNPTANCLNVGCV